VRITNVSVPLSSLAYTIKNVQKAIACSLGTPLESIQMIAVLVDGVFSNLNLQAMSLKGNPDCSYSPRYLGSRYLAAGYTLDLYANVPNSSATQISQIASNPEIQKIGYAAAAPAPAPAPAATESQPLSPAPIIIGCFFATVFVAAFATWAYRRKSRRTSPLLSAKSDSPPVVITNPISSKGGIRISTRTSSFEPIRV
jgi:hypothetical protein